MDGVKDALGIALVVVTRVVGAPNSRISIQVLSAKLG